VTGSVAFVQLPTLKDHRSVLISAENSQAIPFLPKPSGLDADLAGNAGLFMFLGLI
jgi:hypothetical protein